MEHPKDCQCAKCRLMKSFAKDMIIVGAAANNIVRMFELGCLGDEDMRNVVEMCTRVALTYSVRPADKPAAAK